MSDNLQLSLYHNDMSVCAQKVRLVLADKGLEWQSYHLNLRAGEQFKPEFRKLSPKSVVPVLVHDGQVINESSTIIEYLDDVFTASPLMPSDAYLRALVRNWIVQFDAGLHEHVAVISFCIAFRHQLLARYESEEDLQEFLDNIPDPNRAAVLNDIVPNGVQSPRFRLAVFAYDKLLSAVAQTLKESSYLVGDEVSLADYTLLPYVERLEQLQLAEWWSASPQIDEWLARLRDTTAYKEGVGEWLNQGYLQLMAEHGKKGWQQLNELRQSRA